MLPGVAGPCEREPLAFHLCLARQASVLCSHYRGAEPATWFAVLTRQEAPLLGRALWQAGRSQAEAGAAALLAASLYLVETLL